MGVFLGGLRYEGLKDDCFFFVGFEGMTWYGYVLDVPSPINK